MSTEEPEFLPQDAAPRNAGRIDAESYQLAQAATSADALSVAAPRNAQVVVIPVRGGQTVELPTATEAGLIAEIGPEGNLGIIVDRRTIILQGYVAAQGQQPVTIVTNDGDVVDIGDMIAATDPSIDIQTAAGPATGPSGATPPDGNGIYTPFTGGPDLVGFSASGVLGGTALTYSLIDASTAEFDPEDPEDPSDSDETLPPVANAPNAEPDFAVAPPSVPTNFELMLIIDISQSMGEEVIRPDGTTTTRMDLQKAAIASLLDAYVTATAGTVNIKAVTFSGDAAYFGGTDAATFLNVSNPANLAAFIADLNTLLPTINTDYDAALSVAQRGIMHPSWLATDAATKGFVYFFSDGRPTATDPGSPYPGGSSANTLNLAEENLWEGRTSAGAFTSGLADKGVIAFAVGQGEDIAGDATALGQLGRVAYTSEASQDSPVIVVGDETQLTIETLKTAPSTVTGNVLSNDDPGPDGYATSPVVGIAAILDVDTTSQTATTTATGFEIQTNNGLLTIDKTTGDFIYTAAPGSGGKSDTFSYTIADAIGGETDSAILTISIGAQVLASNAAVLNAADPGAMT